MSIRTQINKWREERRLQRQLNVLTKLAPFIETPLKGILPNGRFSFLRIPLALVFILGGVFSFLPLLGVWMMPLGFLLLAVDIPFLRRPVSAVTIRGRRLGQRLMKGFRRFRGA